MSTQFTCVHKKINVREINNSWAHLVACQFVTKHMHLSRSKINDADKIKIKIVLALKFVLTRTPLTNMRAKHGPHASFATMIC